MDYDIKVGDRVKTGLGRIGTVRAIQKRLYAMDIAEVRLDHGGDIAYLFVDRLTRAEQPDDTPTPQPKVGDRVRHNGKVTEDFRRKGGTVLEEVPALGPHVCVQWDGLSMSRMELVSQLEVVYSAPEDSAEPHPAQRVLDLIDAERAETQKKIESLQALMRSLSDAKKKLLAER